MAFALPLPAGQANSQQVQPRRTTPFNLSLKLQTPGDSGLSSSWGVPERRILSPSRADLQHKGTLL
ncbi:hypothetical protein [Pontibacter actiniarum]|uniref:Uncharacterized protein n=1 Tax=Pontibacter actiniarum TaxID=323450 RepID=A0A1X9YVF2_9BACT|nr:hypothetical protein [Pontibacter actiniarum]ARS36897.1 hypothetical protein CA264_16510 [Pontibacter actiniarum]